MSTFENPFIQDLDLQIGKKRVSVNRGSQVTDSKTGETFPTELVQVLHVDKKAFVKLFANGVADVFSLSKPGQKVCAYLLQQLRPGQDEVWLHHSEAGLPRTTFWRGIRELQEKQLLAPSKQNFYWVNPSVLFNGDRIKFVKELTRQKS